MKKIYFFVLLLSFSQLSAQPWYWINPANGHHHLNDISFISPGNGIAVADNGVILHYNDNIWTQAESTVSVNLNAVYYLSPTLAWAVGNNGTILKFNGSDWVQQESPVNVTLNGVCFTDENHGWAVGNTVLFFDGNSWQVQAEASGLKTVSFATPDEGWAAGTWGAIKHYLNGEWMNDVSMDSYDFSGICMTSQNTVFLNGNTIDGNGVFFENTGSGWQSVNSGGVNAGISFADQQHGYGIQNFIAFNTDIYPTVYKYSTGSWSKEFSAKRDRQLTSVEAISENEAYISDTTGFIYHGLDGNWGVSNGFTADSILDISFTRANNGYFACGTDGIWHYDAGNWTNVLKVPGFRFNEVKFIDENYGFAAAYKLSEFPWPYEDEVKVFRFMNGNWVEEIIPITEGILEPATSIGISFWNTLGVTSYNMIYSMSEGVWDTTFLAMNDSITELRFMDPFPINQNAQGALPEMEEAWLSIKRMEGDVKGAIYFNDYTSDTWNVSYETASGAFNDLCVADYMNIYAVGDNGLIAHFDGQNWSEFEPVTSEDLLSVYINDGNEGWAVGKNGTLLKYNGLSWSVVQRNTWNDLFKVCFYQGFGLIGGENGTLISTLEEMPVSLQKHELQFASGVLNIYPNPASDLVFLEIEGTAGDHLMISIYDNTGRLVFSGDHSVAGSAKQIIPVSLKGLKAGLYLVKMNSSNQVITGKLIIR